VRKLFFYAQASAQALQHSAHFWQWSWWEACFSHSAAQALQTSAHNLQSAAQYSESLAPNFTHNAQMSAQSIHSCNFYIFLK